MTVELARRLMRSGVVSDADVEAALLKSVRGDVAFASVLAEQSPVLAQLLERELARLSTPSILTVRAAAELCQRLPEGLCTRLLAIPVRQDARTGTVDVAAVDPLDPHVASEFVFHLGTPVRVVRAPLWEVTSAVELFDRRPVSPRARLDHDERTPAFGTPVERPSSTPPPRQRVSSGPPEPRVEAGDSQPPIPLVRSLTERSRRGTDPGVGSAPPPALDLGAEDEMGEPVIGLLRPKASVPHFAPPARPHDDGSLALVGFAAAESADVVIEQLVVGLQPVARQVILFVPRGSWYEARAVHPRPADSRLLRRLRVPAGKHSVFSNALEAGYYLGRLPEAAGRVELNAVLGADDEVYILPILVFTRAALVAVMSGFESAFTATRRADQLADAAGQALDRLIRAKKHGP